MTHRHMFNKETIGKMKKGSFLVNNARGAICDPPAVVEALKSGQLRGELMRSSTCQEPLIKLSCTSADTVCLEPVSMLCSRASRHK